MRKGYQDRCLTDRRGTNSSKWDDMIAKFGRDDLLPLWVADMDFKTPACVQDALHRLVDQGAFGYFKIPETYYTNFIRWEKTRHHYEIKKEWIRFTPGVVYGLFWVVEMMSNPGDAVAMFSPVYYPFMHAATDTGRKLIMTPMINDNGYYTPDFDRFEKDVIENGVKVFLLCNPHNPVCRVWKPEELKRMLEICRKHHVFVVSDEIHHDLLFHGSVHTPAATVGDYDDMLVTLTAPSKTFNLAGLQNSYVIIPDGKVRKKFDGCLPYLRLRNGNSYGYMAAEAAYGGGEGWLNAVLEEIEGNYDFLCKAVTGKFPKVVFSPLEGTYLSWIDLGAYVPHADLQDFMLNQCRLAPDFGDWFYPGERADDTHIRINLATPRENIATVSERLIQGLETYASSRE
jgi:cystathionine beta-lyase